MSKKEKRNPYQSMLNRFLLNETYRARTIPVQTLNQPRNEVSDYLLEAENAGKLSMEEKNAQEMMNIWQFIYELSQGQLDNREEIENLKKSTQAAKKSLKDSDKALQKISRKLEEIYGFLHKLQKQSNKCKDKITDLASDIKLVKRIIANISFLSGACSMSDNLDKIANSWNKATKRKRKEVKGLKSYSVNALGKEIE